MTQVTDVTDQNDIERKKDKKLNQVELEVEQEAKFLPNRKNIRHSVTSVTVL